MATEINQLMGEVVEDPDHQTKDIDLLIGKFLEALIAEQNGVGTTK